MGNKSEGLFMFTFSFVAGRVFLDGLSFSSPGSRG